MPQTRSRQAADLPRTRRKASTRPQPASRPINEGKVWTNAAGLALVGKPVSVCWPSDGSYYPAIVVGFHPRARKHKLIYLEDESVESVELGAGPSQRDYRILEPFDDPLIGKTLEFPPDASSPEPNWFDFMRGNKEKPGQKFHFIIFAKIASDPDPGEVCSPPRPEGDNTPPKYYRGIYLANEYLATVDLSQIHYRVQPQVQQPPEDPVMEELEDRPAPARRSALPIESQRLAVRSTATEEPAPELDDEVPERAQEQQEDDAEDDPYEPPKDQDVVEESDVEMEGEDQADDQGDAQGETWKPSVKPDPAEAPSPAVAALKRADRKYRAAGTKDLVVDAMNEDSGGKAVTVDRDPGNGFVKPGPGTEVEATPDDSMNVVSLDSGSKAKGEGSVGTQDTRDDPLDHGTPRKKSSKAPPPVPASLYPPLFEDEEGKGRDTASDEEQLGWVTEEKQEAPDELQSQVGDYISLNLGDGKESRKAYVEAYLPGLDQHFIAFCDAEGGNLKVKLTSSNHAVLRDEEVHELSRTPIAKEEPTGAVRSKRRRNVLTLSDTKPNKKREAKTPIVRGNSARGEICGRCLKIVWPGSELVYAALVLGYNPDKGEHLIVYLSDHCVEVLDLRYREWNLLAREDEPWIAQGVLGQRLYVLWNGEYDSPEANERSQELFGGEVKVVYEAYVLSYEGDDKYLILYPSTEDTEVRDLKIEEKDRDDLRPLQREWDILDPGVNEVAGLPVIGWEP